MYLTRDIEHLLRPSHSADQHFAKWGWIASATAVLVKLFGACDIDEAISAAVLHEKDPGAWPDSNRQTVADYLDRAGFDRRPLPEEVLYVIRTKSVVLRRTGKYAA